MFKKSNFIFIITFIFIFIFIGAINYYIDPYEILFHKEKSLYLFNTKKELIETTLNLSKKSKFNYVVMGSSTTNDFLNKDILYDKKTIFMTTNQFDIIKQVDYLDFVLETHPEINTIIFPIEYAFFSIDDVNKTYPVNKKRLTINDISRLLFSKEATQKSVKKILSNISTPKNIKKRKKPIPENINDETFVKKLNLSIFYKRNYKDCIFPPFQKEKFTALEKIKKIVEKRNKKIIFIFPPYHAMAQGAFFIKGKNNEIEYIKKYVTSNFQNVEVIDFAFINKYTSEPLEKTYNYKDIMHPNGEPGHLFYCALKYPNEFKNKDLYIHLTQENIDNTLTLQRKRLKEYTNNNIENINKFMEYEIRSWNERIEKEYYPPNNCNGYLNATK